MKIDRVTMTGADDSIAPTELISLTEEFPFVEWGILFSSAHQGTARFPSEEWIKEYSLIAQRHKFNSSAHLCGPSLIDLAYHAQYDWEKAYAPFVDNFQRVQLNFDTSKYHPVPDCWEILASRKQQFILQIKSTGTEVVRDALNHDVNVAPLFDLSSGTGLIPDEWPEPIEGIYCGYAGGLGPETLISEMRRIKDAVKERTIWIDMETRIRSNDNTLFDINKVRDCLQKSLAYM